MDPRKVNKVAMAPKNDSTKKQNPKKHAYPLLVISGTKTLMMSQVDPSRNIHLRVVEPKKILPWGSTTTPLKDSPPPTRPKIKTPSQSSPYSQSQSEEDVSQEMILESRMKIRKKILKRVG